MDLKNLRDLIQQAGQDADEVEDQAETALRNVSDAKDEFDSLSSSVRSVEQSLDVACDEAEHAKDNAASLCGVIDDIEAEVADLVDELDEANERIEELEAKLLLVSNEQLVIRLQKMEGICRALWIDLEDASEEVK